MTNANPSPDLPASFALPGHSVLEFKGVDAVRFAQAQLMSDVAALQGGAWQWTGWLTPKGRQIWHHGITPDQVVEQPAGAIQLTPSQEGPLDAQQLRASTDAQLLAALQQASQLAAR